jgi:hypothetical protein
MAFKTILYYIRQQTQTTHFGYIEDWSALKAIKGAGKYREIDRVDPILYNPSMREKRTRYPHTTA